MVARTGILLTLAVALSGAALPAPTDAAPVPAHPTTAPARLAKSVSAARKTPPAATLPIATAFSLKDTDGKIVTLDSFRGRPTVLFFFCGCSWCLDVARSWATLQHGNALPGADTPPVAPKQGSASVAPPARPVRPTTVIIYSSDREETAAFAKRSGLDTAQTIFLSDEDLHVTDDLYHADPCPRAFVLDAAGRIRYTNTGKDDQPRVAPADIIVAKTLNALRTADKPPHP